MNPSICRVLKVDIVGEYLLRVHFDDGSEQTIDFRPILAGELYGPPRDLELFNRVAIDGEAHTLVWPNGADLIRPRYMTGRSPSARFESWLGGGSRCRLDRGALCGSYL